MLGLEVFWGITLTLYCLDVQAGRQHKTGVVSSCPVYMITRLVCLSNVRLSLHPQMHLFAQPAELPCIMCVL